MRTYLAFSKKEFMENWRTFRLMIMLIVFLIFGLMSPLTALFTPEILKAAGINPAALGMSNPTFIDSWTQFFKNVGQMGLLVLVIVFSGIMANEFSKGTLINILTKGMNRSTVILSKFTVATVIWTLSYLICLGVCYGYTAFYFTMDGLNNGFISFFSLWLYGVLLISLVIFGGVLFKNIFGSLLLTGGLVVVMTLINIVPKFQKYNPATLTGFNMQLLLDQKNLSDILPAMIISAILIAAVIVASILAFNKKQV